MVLQVQRVRVGFENLLVGNQDEPGAYGIRRVSGLVLGYYIGLIKSSPSPKPRDLELCNVLR